MHVHMSITDYNTNVGKDEAENKPGFCWQRPYHVESTSSRPITEVKQRWARLVLGWVTAWEPRVPLAFFLLIDR